MSTRVLVSFETQDRAQCVDVFQREDGSYGFEHYRGESDGSSRWQSLNRYSHLRFASGEQALSLAKQRVPWLDQTEEWRW